MIYIKRKMPVCEGGGIDPCIDHILDQQGPAPLLAVGTPLPHSLLPDISGLQIDPKNIEPEEDSTFLSSSLF
jgi:hypothetical protein